CTVVPQFVPQLAREKERAARERADQGPADRLWAERRLDDVVHGPGIRDWNPRVNTTNGRPDFGQERVRFTGCPHDEQKRADAKVLGSNQNLRPPVGMSIIEASLINDADDRKRAFTVGD